MDILGSRVILRPDDYAVTLAFYRDGLELAIAREYPGGTVFFAGQSLIEVAAHGRAGDAPEGFAGALWLQVRDAEEAAAELARRGVAIDRAPRREPWGLIEMWVRDPDGVPIVLVEIPPEHPIRRDSRPPTETQ
ncbi:glyoxalase/bleomycin resistance/dioxygenase family protein [Nocardia uniformis]|uniref:Glyoxalase/bleomycin resistance/dioxygenase family protein n=1 Tax=Nocardia uniformis TaxID=53432 RepID=A0A849C9T8_9NOCA|nr:VOC family protein [Nocardia uniformis]NNH75404.1 glyoxalase/bleomycin resistance/dioxygenase family protein [Nocardia uniformis]